MHAHVGVNALKREGLSNCLVPPPSCPLLSGRGGQRHYSAIKLLFAGVTHSGGCVDGGGKRPRGPQL